MIKTLVFLLALSSVFTDDRIKVDLYAEALCPYCMQVLTGTFIKTLNTPEIDKIADINFYPYGNAKHSTDKCIQFCKN